MKDILNFDEAYSVVPHPTRIVSITNRTLGTLRLTLFNANSKSVSDASEELIVEPESAALVDLWVPIYSSRSDYENRHSLIQIDITGSGPSSYDSVDSPSSSLTIWQRGGYVVYNRTDNFESAELVGGHCAAGGLRSVELVDHILRFY